MESGLRIGPEQYSNLLYGKNTYKSQMQSILDKVCVATVRPHDVLCTVYYGVRMLLVWLQLWSSGVLPSGLSELDIVLQRSEDAQELSHLLPDLEYLVDMKLEGLSDKGKECPCLHDYLHCLCIVEVDLCMLFISTNREARHVYARSLCQGGRITGKDPSWLRRLCHGELGYLAIQLLALPLAGCC